MGVKLNKVPQLNTEQLSDSEALLLQLVRERDECIQELKDEIARLKGEKEKPQIKPSRLEPKKKRNQQKESEQQTSAQENSDSPEKEKKKRAGSAKRKKTLELTIHENKVIKPIEEIPPGSEFKGYQDYTVQELLIKPHNIRYRLARWKTPTGEYLRGRLPEPVVKMGHFGPILKSYLLYQYHHCHVTQPKLLTMMSDWGIHISSGQLNRILVEDKEEYHREKQEILQVGLSVSSYINTDDTGARHQGVNSYCTHIGNEWFAWFETTPRKNRINFLELLRGERTDYVLSHEALTYMAKQKLPKKLWHPLSLSINRVFKDFDEWRDYLTQLGFIKPRHIQTATEGALLGALIESGLKPDLGIMSDGAGQFRLLEHALCWVHAERLINRLIPITEAQRQAVETVQDQLWDFYQELKTYKTNNTQQQQLSKPGLEERFEQIFTQTTLFETLNQVLRRLYRRRSELLKVLDRPDLPLHNNASEQDIREFVTKRQISGSTRSEAGRRCRDTFASLKKTCRKLSVSFWEYLKDRVSGKNAIPTLGTLIANKAIESQCPLAENSSLCLA